MSQDTRIIVFFAAVYIFRVEASWLGATYWSSRYSDDELVYRDDPDSGILWNDYIKGRRGYEPRTVTGSSCGSCICSSTVIDCSSASGTV